MSVVIEIENEIVIEIFCNLSPVVIEAICTLFICSDILTRSLFNSSEGVDSEISAINDFQKIVQRHVAVAKHYKQRFVNEYLSALEERHYYWNKRKGFKNNIKFGDVVFIKEGQISRLKWQKGKITSLSKSKDGLVRSVELAIYQKQRNKVNNIKRPVQLILPMEITNTDDNITNNKNVNEPAKDEKRRSQWEPEKNANMLSKPYEY